MTTLVWPLWIFLAVHALPGASQGKQNPPDSSQFSILGVTIGRDNLATLQSTVGPVKKCRTNEHDGVEVAGYSAPREVIVFEFGDVGGGDVTAFSLNLPSRVIGCPLSRLSSETSELTTKGGVHLGMTEDEFARIFGPPTNRTRRGEWKYDWTLEAKYSKKEKKAAAVAGQTVSETYLVGITVEARFAKGVLQYFYISKLETT